MKKKVLFIQGGGEDGYKADQAMVNSLVRALGNNFDVSYPELKDKGGTDFGWPDQILEQLEKISEPVVLIGHSVGASLILKCLSEKKITNTISGIYLLATPFWDGDEDWQQGLKLKKDFAKKITSSIPLYLFHSMDDMEVPFSHFSIYGSYLPKATLIEMDSGGHQFNNNLGFLAEIIRNNEV